MAGSTEGSAAGAPCLRDELVPIHATCDDAALIATGLPARAAPHGELGNEHFSGRPEC